MRSLQGFGAFPEWSSKMGVLAPRVFGSVTVVSSACMIWMAWKRREYMFHRLILGMAINLFVMGAFFIYGDAAFPEGIFQDTYSNVPDDYLRGHGTITTCNIQGFFIEFCIFSALFYYSMISVYSYVGVLNNFQVSKISWIEKYIHVGAHIFPLAVTITELSLEHVNPAPYGFCSYSTRWPLLCESDECERGSPETQHYWLNIGTSIFLLLISTTVMGALYWKVKRNQSAINIAARYVAIQSFFYLLVLYVIVILIGSVPTFFWLWDSGKVQFTNAMRIFFYVVVYCITTVFPLFTLAVYRYFSCEEYHRIDNSIIGRKSCKADRAAAKGGDPKNEEECESATSVVRYSFNIFDGTNAAGQFADFVHDGDEDDEAFDAKETEHWNGMQGL
mmetsp:Transcript_21863/g.52011  ORF Transcript_21863/g.52011 Transcript_21863/m.52011 type:complete len:390 (+) Transcript_21863:111-1280(+)